MTTKPHWPTAVPFEEVPINYGGGASTMGATTLGGSTIGGSTYGGSTIGASTIGGSTIGYPPPGGLAGLLQEGDESDYYHVEQKYGYYSSMVLSILQLFIIMIMMVMLGVAPMDVNPMIRPYPDALSDWGGKKPIPSLMSRNCGAW
jgi:hypothetical protein